MKRQIKSVGVFCGSSKGFDSEYTRKAKELGSLFSRKGVTMIYGGGNVGLMGDIADVMIQANASVIGVIPGHIKDLELGHKGITRLEEVDTMAERKSRIIDLSDAFIVLPGGYGTMDELFEVLVSNQLRLTEKPIGLLNVKGFFNPLFTFIQHGVQEGFIREEHFNQIILEENPEVLLEKLSYFSSVNMDKWIQEIKTA